MGLTNLTELTLQIERDLNLDFNKSKEIAKYFLKSFQYNTKGSKQNLIGDFCFDLTDSIYINDKLDKKEICEHVDKWCVLYKSMIDDGDL